MRLKTIGVALACLSSASWATGAEVTAPTGASAGGITNDSENGIVLTRLSKPKEIVLSMDSVKFMLDLDTGETMDPPATARPEQQSRMDVRPDQDQPYKQPTSLLGLRLSGVRTRAKYWDTFASVVAHYPELEKQPLLRMEFDSANDSVYFFRTHTGTRGILQLTALVDDPKGIRLRYKTLETVKDTDVVAMANSLSIPNDRLPSNLRLAPKVASPLSPFRRNPDATVDPTTLSMWYDEMVNAWASAKYLENGTEELGVNAYRFGTDGQAQPRAGAATSKMRTFTKGKWRIAVWRDKGVSDSAFQSVCDYFQSTDAQ